MIVDLDQSEPVAQPHANVCIAGAGAAGISLALELAKSGFQVTLLESGGWEEEQATQDLYASEVSGVPHAGIHKGRFRILGGTTTRWAGQILELDPRNFDVRPWIPNSGWPFSGKTLTSYYRRALDLEGLGSVMSDDDSVWRAIKCRPPDLGDKVVPFFSRWCPEPNFARLHGQALKESGKITVYLHANLCEIVLTEEQTAIAGFRCRTLAGRGAVFTADQYVVCLGGIESARVLLQPLARARTAPWNAHGLVGRYFQDHIDAVLLEVKPRSKRQLHRWFDNVYRSGLKYHPQLKLSVDEQQRLGCLAISATFSFAESTSATLAEFSRVVGEVRRGTLGKMDIARAARHLPLGVLLRKTLRFGLRGRGYNPSDGGILLNLHCEQAPNAESRVELTSERDAMGLFRSRLNWAISPLEIHTIRQFARVIGEEFRHSGFADVVPHPALEAGGSEMINLLSDSYHHIGTTRMADSPQSGVVDKNLRLFGVRNGYVCSSAVFPTSAFSNPTHTIIALAVRLADHLAAVDAGRRTCRGE